MDTRPKDVGMSKRRLKRIGPAVEQHIGEGKIAGAVTLVARRGKVVQVGAYGLAERETNKPMAIDSIFRMYSMTKPITMVAILTLFEQGKLRLIDPVSKFIPAFGDVKVIEDEKSATLRLVDVERPVTIHHLMTHTSGLTYHFGDQGLVEKMYRDTAIFGEKPLSQFIDNLAEMPLAFQPGTKFRYSTGHDVAARVVEIASGMSYGEYLETAIFKPLGMNDTGFFVPGEKLDRLTAEYGLFDVRDPQISEAEHFVDLANEKCRLLRGPRDGIEARPHEIYRGGHGLLSTADDYYRFCRMLLHNGEFDGARILSRKTVELMTSNHLTPEQFPSDWTLSGFGFGLGVRVATDPAQSQNLCSPGEHGWGGAAGTYYWIDPIEELIGIYMIQFQPGGHFMGGSDFKTAVYQAIDD